MNTWAGCELNHKNPNPAPTMAEQSTVSSPLPGKNGICKYSATRMLLEANVRIGVRPGHRDRATGRQTVESVREIDRVRAADDHQAIE